MINLKTNNKPDLLIFVTFKFELHKTIPNQFKTFIFMCDVLVSKTFILGKKNWQNKKISEKNLKLRNLQNCLEVESEAVPQRELSTRSTWKEFIKVK